MARKVEKLVNSFDTISFGMELCIAIATSSPILQDTYLNRFISTDSCIEIEQAVRSFRSAISIDGRQYMVLLDHCRSQKLVRTNCNLPTKVAYW